MTDHGSSQSELFRKAEALDNGRAFSEALSAYLSAAHSPGLGKELAYRCFYRAAQITAELGLPPAEVLDTYEKARQILPDRAEPSHGASRYCRLRNMFREGYDIAARAIDLSIPPSGSYVEPWIYEWGLLDEYAVNAYWIGRHRDALNACLEIFSRNKFPDGHRQRIASNAKLSLASMPKEPDYGSLGEQTYLQQHSLRPGRQLRSKLEGTPRVLVAIIVKQKERELPLYLNCIDAMAYPKEFIHVYIRTNNNTDQTLPILREWISSKGTAYASVEIDSDDIPVPVERFASHEWNATRFKVLGGIRNTSLQKTFERDCNFYFTCDVDIFLRPNTLRELVATNLPIVAPMVRNVDPGNYYANLFADANEAGYIRDCDQYRWILERRVRGLIEVASVDAVYLVRRDVIPELTYVDGTDRWEFMIFSASARSAGIPQYYDNRQLYGYITHEEGSKAAEHQGKQAGGQIETAMRLLGGEVPNVLHSGRA